MIYFLIMMAVITVQLVPPKNWWGNITYFITWPIHLSVWLKINFEKYSVSCVGVCKYEILKKEETSES